MEEKCLNCGNVLWGRETPDTDTYFETQLTLKRNGNDFVIECPHCKAKNIVIRNQSQGGLEQLKLSHLAK